MIERGPGGPDRKDIEFSAESTDQENAESGQEDEIKVGDIARVDGTAATYRNGQGTECEVLEVTEDRVKVRLREGKYVGEDGWTFMKSEVKSTGRTIAQIREQDREEMRLRDEKTRKSHEGAKVGDTVIGRGTSITRDGTRAEILSIDPDDDMRVVVRITEGKRTGFEIELYGSEWKLDEEQQ
ncbi:MAG: hypothetical protein ABIB97_02280 [Patescibacteria group bacterium]